MGEWIAFIVFIFAMMVIIVHMRYDDDNKGDYSRK
jgi:hypothetical protein